MSSHMTAIARTCTFCAASFVALGLVAVCPRRARAFDISGPAGSVEFGRKVVLLPNGNLVVTDPAGYASGVGAVYLYSPDGTLISTLTGDQANDNVGSGGVRVLANGNYLILSPNWANGSAGGAGAVTWASETTGVSGVVSASNSLVGTTAADQVGVFSVIALSNGNYVVASPYWDAGATANVGAATWGNGTGGTVGAVSVSNSLVGATAQDEVGGYLTALSNGNYVVASPNWNNGTATTAGAVTWGNGNGGTAGPVSAANSLVGTSSQDGVGNFGVTPLRNGNYVVASPYWNDGANSSVGAATWGDGAGGTFGPVSAGNSLVGATARDQVGASVTVLDNGNYVVASVVWDNGAAADAGAATWGDGNGGTAGPVSASNSLVGTTAGDFVGVVTALSNGNYVVASTSWDNGATADVGAATWGDGDGGTVGPVSASNSLVGSTVDDVVGTVTALSNGNYVVSASHWHNGSTNGAGAATWADGNGGTVGPVTAINSLVGTTDYDYVGIDVAPLANGNYVVASPYWDDGAIADVGAATWGNGHGGTVGPVSAGNSLIGASAGENVGYGGVAALDNGDYVVASPHWSAGGAATNLGALTWADGSRVSIGSVSGSNSLVGTSAGDMVGYDYYDAELLVTALPNGDYIVSSPYWRNGSLNAAGAITLRRGTDSSGDTITPQNSVAGLLADEGGTMSVAYDASRDELIVGKREENIVTVFKADLLFRNGFE